MHDDKLIETKYSWHEQQLQQQINSIKFNSTQKNAFWNRLPSKSIASTVLFTFNASAIACAPSLPISLATNQTHTQSSILLVPFFSRTIAFKTNNNQNKNQLNQIQLKFNSKECILKSRTAHKNFMHCFVHLQCFCNRMRSFIANSIIYKSNAYQSSIC